jgi:lipoprotein-anchoring transpeptidase ErfK/SrfK
MIMLLPRGFKQSLGSLVCVAAVSLLPAQAIRAPHRQANAQSASIAPVISPTLMARNDSISTAVRRLEKSKQRWIEIKLSSQRLIAWEGKTPVYAIMISTGKDSTPTNTGVYAIQTRDRYVRMRGADYDITDVPYTMYYDGSYAIHGAYWHHRFGTPVSHGCVNVAVNHARWLFHWATIGTPVVVRR